MKVLVIGGTGTVGTAVVNALRAAGHEHGARAPVAHAVAVGREERGELRGGDQNEGDRENRESWKHRHPIDSPKEPRLASLRPTPGLRDFQSHAVWVHESGLW